MQNLVCQKLYKMVVGDSWNNENTVIFCDVCIDFITKNGRGQVLRWREIEDLFAEKIGKRWPVKSLKNKYDAMKKDWGLWKFLKTGETGLGWNSTTGKLYCSDEWWDKKLKEKPDAKKFRNKGVLPIVEEKWDHLFGDAVATGKACVAPSLDPNHIPISLTEDEEIQNTEDGADGAYRHKRKRRQSVGSVYLRQHLQKVDEMHYDIVDAIKGNTTKKSDLETSVDQVMDIMNRIGEDGDVEVGGNIWCNAMLMFRDPATREIFFKMPNDLEMDDTQRNYLLSLVALTNLEESVVAATYFYTYIYKEPCMTSIQTEEAWVNDILNGNPIRCVNVFRMSATMFRQLCNELEVHYGLKQSRRISVKEKVALFLYTLALGLSNRDVGERFQRSGETVSRAFHDVLESICGRNTGYMRLAREYIKPKDSTFQAIPPHIENDSRYMPYFKDCIGCIDGTHIDACIPVAEQMRYRGRKGIPTFNVMAVCDFEMCFTFISVGWEGSAHDTRVFLHAIETPAMNFPKPPEGKYYIVDKGYPDRKGYLAPYSRIRYHQSQFEHVLPTNAQEAFNRVHSSLRSCIERSFGVLKKRWKILRQMPSFNKKTQIDVIMATFALHNYIRRNDSTYTIFIDVGQNPQNIPTEELGETSGTANLNTRGTNNEMRQVCNNIADMIWSARNVF
ncbi:hypothetical protein LXL04_023917 [Taraxacum kok-saghyz]